MNAHYEFVEPAGLFPHPRPRAPRHQADARSADLRLRRCSVACPATESDWRSLRFASLSQFAFAFSWQPEGAQLSSGRVDYLAVMHQCVVSQNLVNFFERSFKSTLKHDLISTRIREAHVGGGA